MAKKLSQCGVFGVSSDEYLNYAESNRNEWEARGKEVVRELAIRAQQNYEKRFGKPKSGVNARGSEQSKRPSNHGATLTSVRSSFFNADSTESTRSAAPFGDDELLAEKKIFDIDEVLASDEISL